MAPFASSQSPPQLVNPSESVSKPSSVNVLQLSSTLLQISVALGLMAPFASSQSPPQLVKPSESVSKPSSMTVSQFSSTPLQTSVAPG